MELHVCLSDVLSTGSWSNKNVMKMNVSVMKIWGQIAKTAEELNLMPGKNISLLHINA